jgi:hypothetical protein
MLSQPEIEELRRDLSLLSPSHVLEFYGDA